MISTIIDLSAVLNSVLAYFLFREKISFGSWTGILISMGGLMVI
jgi:drug/metabolite transporter (DMT)-like permease